MPNCPLLSRDNFHLVSEPAILWKSCGRLSVFLMGKYFSQPVVEEDDTLLSEESTEDLERTSEET